MKDGEIEQIGTPEALVLAPATNYVEEFTKGILHSKALSVKSIMEPIGSSNSVRTHITVPESAKIDDIAAIVVDDNVRDVSVVDADDQVVGLLRKDAVIDVLVNKAS